MSEEVEKAIEANAEHFMDRGPGLSYGYTSYIVARDQRGYVLRGGLGAMGVGQMWSREHESDRDEPGYADAAVLECPQEEIDFYGWEATPTASSDKSE